MKFIVLTNKQTRDAIYINPEFISSFLDGDEYSGTSVYMADGNGDPYHVVESAYLISRMIENCEKQGKRYENNYV